MRLLAGRLGAVLEHGPSLAGDDLGIELAGKVLRQLVRDRDQVRIAVTGVQRDGTPFDLLFPKAQRRLIRIETRDCPLVPLSTGR